MSATRNPRRDSDAVAAAAREAARLLGAAWGLVVDAETPEEHETARARYDAARRVWRGAGLAIERATVRGGNER